MAGRKPHDLKYGVDVGVPVVPVTRSAFGRSPLTANLAALEPCTGDHDRQSFFIPVSPDEAEAREKAPRVTKLVTNAAARVAKRALAEGKQEPKFVTRRTMSGNVYGVRVYRVDLRQP